MFGVLNYVILKLNGTSGREGAGTKPLQFLFLTEAFCFLDGEGEFFDELFVALVRG